MTPQPKTEGEKYREQIQFEQETGLSIDGIDRISDRETYWHSFAMWLVESRLATVEKEREEYKKIAQLLLDAIEKHAPDLAKHMDQALASLTRKEQ